MNRKLLENLVSLLCVQALNYLAPLLTLPLLTRALGPEIWGKLAFAESYANYLSLLVEYGFGFSATREIAQTQGQKDLHSDLLTGVLTVQTVLASVAMAGTMLAVWLIPSLQQYRIFMLTAAPVAVLRAVTPYWYFQGIERMRFIATMNIIVNVFSALLIIATVHGPAQALWPLIIRGFSALVALSVSLKIVYMQLSFCTPNIRTTRRALREGWSVFLFKSALSLYTTGNVLLMGVMAPPTAVAWFAGGERIVKAATSAFSPITQAFYPRISSLMRSDLNEAMRTARQSLKITVLGGIAIGLTMLIFAQEIVTVLLGANYQACVPVIRVFSILPLLIGTSTVLGIQWMLPMRLDSAYTRVILWAGGLNVALAFVLARRYGAVGMAESVTFAEAFVAIAILAILSRSSLAPWSILLNPSMPSTVPAAASESL